MRGGIVAHTAHKPRIEIKDNRKYIDGMNPREFFLQRIMEIEKSDGAKSPMSGVKKSPSLPSIPCGGGLIGVGRQGVARQSLQGSPTASDSIVSPAS